MPKENIFLSYDDGRLKGVFNKTGMKQIINSSFKEFDKQTNCLSTGNIIANTLLGSYIRPYSETNCNHQNFEPGYLCNYDLKWFDNLPHGLRTMLQTESRKESYILYELRIYRHSCKEILGYILTDNNYKLIHKEVNRNVLPHSAMYERRWAALCEAQKYLCATRAAS